MIKNTDSYYKQKESDNRWDVSYFSLCSSLQDDISKIAFEQRLKYYYERDREHIWKMYERIEPHDKLYRKSTIHTHEPIQSIFDLIRAKREGVYKDKQIILYGCGGASKMPLITLRHYGLAANFYCDRNPVLHGTQHHGLLVLSPEQLISEYPDASVITASFVHAADMLSFLSQLGFNPAQVYYSQFFPEQMYFGFPEFEFSENEVYLDCGVSDGETIKQFHDRVNGRYKKIYAFEPEPTCYQRSLDFIKKAQIPNVCLMNFGVYDSDAVIRFTSGANGVAHIGESGDIEVTVKRIDDILADDEVTFIKIDIEGAELSALKGAEATIRKHKPKLAICLYHKPEDVPSIPQYIHSIVPEYKMWIRPYEVGLKESGDIHLGETILYACI